MISKGVEAPNPDRKPKTEISRKVSLNSDWLIGMLLRDQQEHVVLGEITFT